MYLPNSVTHCCNSSYNYETMAGLLASNLSNTENQQTAKLIHQQIYICYMVT